MDLCEFDSSIIYRTSSREFKPLLPPPKSCAIKSVFDYIYIIGDITDYFGKCLVNIKSATNTVLFLMFFLVF